MDRAWEKVERGGLGKRGMMEKVGGDREGRKRGGWRRKEHLCTWCKDNISVHSLYNTIQNIASVPSHPPKIWKEMEREETSGRDEHGRGECMCES